MNFRQFGVAAALLLATLAATSGFAGTPAGPYHLDSDAQLATEQKVLRLLVRPELRQAGKAIAATFAADPSFKTLAGRARLRQAAEEHLFAATFNTVADDPSRPKILWVSSPAHTWHGLSVPGSRYGVDNPDNIYRMMFLDDAHEYRIRGRHGAGDPPAQFRFELLTQAHGTNPEPSMHALGRQISFLLDKNVRTDADGSFTISIGPRGEGSNHMQSVGAHVLVIRDTLSDWNHQAPNDLSVELVSGLVAPEPSDAELTRKAARLAPETARLWLDFRQSYYATTGHGTVNAPPSPHPREGGWGYAAPSQLKLGADDALVITISSLGARYIGFQLADPWMISQDYWSRCGSINNGQAVANADGSVTYVIARKDPGVANWLDADGLDAGSLLIRWQNLVNQNVSPADAVREARIVPVTSVAQSAGARRSTGAQRAALARARAEGFARRVAETPRN